MSGLELAEPFGGLDAVAPRHIQVHQDHVGAAARRPGGRVVAVDGRADDRRCPAAGR